LSFLFRLTEKNITQNVLHVNVEIYLKGTEFENMDCMHLAQDRIQYKVV